MRDSSKYWRPLRMITPSCKPLKSLEEIDSGNPKAIEVLINVLETTQDDYTRMLAAQSLEKIDPGNPMVN
jgi:hypothetical protein